MQQHIRHILLTGAEKRQHSWLHFRRQIWHCCRPPGTSVKSRDEPLTAVCNYIRLCTGIDECLPSGLPTILDQPIWAVSWTGSAFLAVCEVLCREVERVKAFITTYSTVLHTQLPN